MSDGGEAVKPEGGGEEGEGQKITIRVRDANGEEIFFKVKNTTKMSKVFKAYAERKGVRPETMRFMGSDGKAINAEHTPKLLGFEDEETIEVAQAQVGGWC
eukprot:TRINITY_DN6400_c0_g1_i1.p1 TRINITY_DN6400_c0_g1~~TRINITY_DN6400_c0_g1_i1.p1  ORF type:complete len:108 (+),score=24.10 TRINITY_DN6400_c0_g1_i1:24-326(+)